MALVAAWWTNPPEIEHHCAWLTRFELTAYPEDQNLCAESIYEGYRYEVKLEMKLRGSEFEPDCGTGRPALLDMEECGLFSLGYRQTGPESWQLQTIGALGVVWVIRP